MDTKKLSRRDLLKLMGSAMVVTAGGCLLAAC